MTSTNSFSKDGMTNVVFNLYRSVDKSDIQIDFLTITEPLDPCYRAEIEHNGGRLFVVKRTMKSVLSYILNFIKIAKGYDIVHVHGNSATMVLEMIACWCAGVRVRIAHSHSTMSAMPMLDKMVRPLFYKLCNARLACGKNAGAWLFKRHEFTVINNGISTLQYLFDQQRRDSIRTSLQWSDCKVVGHVGNFVDVKNHSFIIDIFREAVVMASNVRLLLLGDGPLRNKIEHKAQALGLKDKICFTGSVDNVADYMCAIDVIVMPSKFEGLPLTLIEEQANGLKALCSDVITTEVDKTNSISYLSLNKNAKEWAELLLKIELPMNRMKTSKHNVQMIIDSGYDINYSAKMLKRFYLSKLEKYELR